METFGIATRGRVPATGLSISTFSRAEEGLPVPGMTPFNSRLDTEQGRVAPTAAALAAGVYAMVLGSDFDGRLADLAPGDFVHVVQDVDITGVHVLRASMALRTPDDVPDGWAWRASITVDGTVAGQALGWKKKIRRPDIAANVSKLDGIHTIGLRLDLVEV